MTDMQHDLCPDDSVLHPTADTQPELARCAFAPPAFGPGLLLLITGLPREGGKECFYGIFPPGALLLQGMDATTEGWRVVEWRYDVDVDTDHAAERERCLSMPVKPDQVETELADALELLTIATPQQLDWVADVIERQVRSRLVLGDDDEREALAIEIRSCLLDVDGHTRRELPSVLQEKNLRLSADQLELWMCQLGHPIESFTPFDHTDRAAA